MSNKNGSLESLTVIAGTPITEIKSVFIVDLYNKRKLKNSVPTAILNALERNADSSKKELANRIVGSSNKAVTKAFNTALAVAVAKNRPRFSLRSFIERRITAVIRYYTATDVITDVFNGSFPIIRRNDNGLDRYTLAKTE